MKHLNRSVSSLALTFLLIALLSGCATLRQETQPYETSRDKTAKGAGIGAAAGAAAAILDGKREADEILAGAAIGAVVGGGIGAYMDRQEEKINRIPGTWTERVSDDTLLVHFDSEILFDVDSALLDSSGRGSLDQLASVMTEFGKTAIVVQGHTDSTGSEQHNQDLSERRAKAVANYFIGRGIDSGRLTSVGYGEGSPVASNADEGGRQRNRRVDVMLRAKAR